MWLYDDIFSRQGIGRPANSVRFAAAVPPRSITHFFWTTLQLPSFSLHLHLAPQRSSGKTSHRDYYPFA